MDRRAWFWLLALGAIWGASYMFIAIGLRDLSPAMVAFVRVALAAAVLILVAATPLWTALLAIWVDHEERSQGLRLVGVLLGFAGVGLLLGVDLGGEGAELLGGLAVVLAALGYAIGGLLVKHRLAGIAPVGMSALVLVASSLMLLPAALATAPDSVPGAGPLAAVATLGVVGTGIAFVIA